MNDSMSDLAMRIHALVVIERQKANMSVAESLGAIALVHANWANIYHWTVMEKNYPNVDDKIDAFRESLPAKNPGISMDS